MSISRRLSRRIFLTVAGTALVVSTARRAHAHSTAKEEADMEITRIGSQPSARGPADWFTGTVRIDPLFPAKSPARAAGNSVWRAARGLSRRAEPPA